MNMNILTSFASSQTLCLLSCLMIINQIVLSRCNRTDVARLIIDAAPSVVSYQGSSQTYAHLVISPRGRALGTYVAPLNLNHTVHQAQDIAEATFTYLHIRPVYKGPF